MTICAQCASGDLPCSAASRWTTGTQMTRSPSRGMLSSGGRSAGKDSTLVGESLYRYSLFSAWLSAASTSLMVSSLPGSSRRARAAQRMRLSSSGWPGSSVALCMSTSTVIAALLALLMFLFMAKIKAVVGFNDALYQGVAYHVLGSEVGEADTFDVLEHIYDMRQP